MATLIEILRELAKLNAKQRWKELRDHAIAAADAHESADVAAYAAHAMRQLGELEDGYAWAVRARAIDPANLFAINRVSLLANLTKRYAEAYDCGLGLIEREPLTEGDRQNLAVTIVNAIHGASQLQKIPEAAERFTPVIERLDHPDLHFNSACLYALAGDDTRALTYVAKSLAHDKPKDAFADADFERIREDARFVALLARDWRAENAALKRSRKPSRDQLVPEDFLDTLVAGTASDVRHAELERAIDAAVDDRHGYDVYSDWLQSAGDPRGLFLLASKRCDEARDETERMLAHVEWAQLLAEHAGAWLGAFAPHANASRWRWGFVRDLVFDTGYSGKRDQIGPLFASTLALPVCRFVRSIAVRDIWCKEELDYDAIVDVLRDAWPLHLRALEIAPDDFQMSWTHTDITPLADDRLESLIIGGGDLTLGALRFPSLKSLAIRTGGLTRDNFDAIARADLPHLEALELWFGDQDHGADAFTAGDLAPLLDRNVRRLGLKNADFTDDIVRALAGWRGLPYVTHLDLSMGTLTEAGARVLVDSAAHFAHLEVLDVSDNALPSEACAALCKMLPKTVTGTQKRERYVSIGE
jgi:uncharacterized protein (TIGR02996 family)